MYFDVVEVRGEQMEAPSNKVYFVVLYKACTPQWLSGFGTWAWLCERCEVRN